MKYREMRDKCQELIDGTPIRFAFNQKQFDAVLEEFQCTKEELTSVPGGGLMRIVDFHLLGESFKSADKLLVDFMSTDEGLLEALEYEFANHEFCITHDASEALGALGLSCDDERVARLLPIAFKSYMAGVE